MAFILPIARLLIVVIVDAMIPMSGRAGNLKRRLAEVRLVNPFVQAIWKVSRRAAHVAVGAHRAIPVIGRDWAFRGVDRYVVEMDAEPIALGVPIGEKPRLQHLVR